MLQQIANSKQKYVCIVYIYRRESRSRYVYNMQYTKLVELTYLYCNSIPMHQVALLYLTLSTSLARVPSYLASIYIFVTLV
jgi:hypothetical protein